MPKSYRRSPKRAALIERIRSGIVSGDLPPGTQLPPRIEMVKSLSTCMHTLQGALRTLQDDGFIRSKPHEGTFVTDKPPHLSRYAFVARPDPRNDWQGFMAVLRSECAAIEKELGCEFVFRENVTERPDTLQYQGLLDDIRAHRVAGLIFRDGPGVDDLLDSPIVTAPGVPRVVLTGNPSQASAGPATVSCIGGDNSLLAERALTWLAERGRSQVAVLARGEFCESELDDFLLGAQRRGMTTHPCWIHQAVYFQQGRSLTELLMFPRPDERPDAMILMNESLIEPVGLGILASGVRAGSDVDIVAYSNMPCVGSPAVPMRRLGIDMRQRLRVAVRLLDRQQRGESVPPCVLLPSVFEEELSRPPGVVGREAGPGKEQSVAANESVRW